MIEAALHLNSGWQRQCRDISSPSRARQAPVANGIAPPHQIPLRVRLLAIPFATLLLIVLAGGRAMAQTALVFRLDGDDTTYIFGVNERGELQTLYWGGRLGAHDSVPPAH